MKQTITKTMLLQAAPKASCGGAGCEYKPYLLPYAVKQSDVKIKKLTRVLIKAA